MTRKKIAPKRAAVAWEEEGEDFMGELCPVVGEVRDCRQITATHWEGIDVDGTVIRVCGTLPEKMRLVVPLKRFVRFRTEWGATAYGLIRLIPAPA
jgi:hypothetical protein